MAAMTQKEEFDWSAIRDRIDLVEVATRLLGQAPGRRGERSGRLWWVCRFHEDRNPSLSVKPGGRQWRCFGCGAKGDAVDLARRLNPGMSFPEAVCLVKGGPATAAPRPSPPARPNLEPPPEGWADHAAALVVDAERRLWSPEGAGARAYLHGRGLADDTIRAARLGVVTTDRPGVPAGITIPWLDGPAPRLVNVRRPEGADPRYRAIKGSRRGGLYPGAGAVRPGLPLVVVEGEFDALFLGQELAGLASVATLGAASGGLTAEVLAACLPAPSWLVATDADVAGDRAAAAWLAYPRSRRVRPPGGSKDWTEAHQAGVGLRRWWESILAGDPAPPLFTWQELAAHRWGPAVGDPTPGLSIGMNAPTPDVALLARIAAEAANDEYAIAEREAIQSEGVLTRDEEHGTVTAEG